MILKIGVHIYYNTRKDNKKDKMQYLLANNQDKGHCITIQTVQTKNVMSAATWWSPLPFILSTFIIFFAIHLPVSQKEKQRWFVNTCVGTDYALIVVWSTAIDGLAPRKLA